MTDELPTAARVTDAGIRALYRLENRWQAWLDVEAALAKAQEELGIIPAGAAEAIERAARFELLDQLDLPFPLGGCFGFWGYDLKNFVEPRLPRHSPQDLELPDCHVGFYDSLMVFDHRLGKTWIVSTGLNAEGERSPKRATEALEIWRAFLRAHCNLPERRHNLTASPS